MRSIAPLAACLLAAPLCGQDRRPLVGAVVDAAGKPVAGAEVTCVWRAPFEVDFAHDEVVATSDARGRFRAELGRNVFYSVWAIGSRREDGSFLASEVARAGAGQALELRLAATATPRELRITGLEGWDPGSAVALRIHRDGNDHGGIRIPLLKGRLGVRIPPLPVATCGVIIEDAQGHALVAGTFRPDDPDPVLALPPSALRKVRVTGVPAAGTSVHVQWLPRRQEATAWLEEITFPLARSAPVPVDESGTARVRLPAPHAAPLARGSARIGATAAGTIDWEDHAPRRPASGEPELRFLMEEATEWRGRLLAAGKPVAGVELVCRTEDRFQGGSSGRTRVVRSEADGTFRIPDVPTRGMREAHVYLRGADVGAALPKGAAPMLLEVEGVSCGNGELAVPDLATLRVLDVLAVAKHELPVQAMLTALPAAAAAPRLWFHGCWIPVDSAGHASLLVLPTDHVVYATLGTSHAAAAIDTAACSSGRIVELPLAPIPLARFACVDAAGKPLAGVTVVGMGGLAPDLPEEPVARFLARLAEELDFRCARLQSSAPDGSLAFPVLGRKELALRVTLQAGDTKRSVPVVTDGDAQTVRF